MDVKSLVRPLASHRPDYLEFETAVRAAVNGGIDGDSALAEALHHPQLQAASRSPERLLVAAALGDASGPAGPEALRRVLAGGKISRDLRCASLLALAKRIRAGATPDLIRGLAFPDGVVKSYAVIGLACTGDDRAWEAVLDRLLHLLRRSPLRQDRPSQVLVALAYLGQFATDPERSSRVRTEVRKRWNQLDPGERSWIGRYWPALAGSEVEPGKDVAVDPLGLRHWARDNLPWRSVRR